MTPNSRSFTRLLLRENRHAQSGQGVLEYILMMFTVVFFFMLIVTGLARMDITRKFMAPIKERFSAAYRFGDPKAKIGSGGAGLPEQGHIRFNQHLFFDPIVN